MFESRNTRYEQDMNDRNVSYLVIYGQLMKKWLMDDEEWITMVIIMVNDGYPLVNDDNELERSTMFNG